MKRYVYKKTIEEKQTNQGIHKLITQNRSYRMKRYCFKKLVFCLFGNNCKLSGCTKLHPGSNIIKKQPPFSSFLEACDKHIINRNLASDQDQEHLEPTRSTTTTGATSSIRMTNRSRRNGSRRRADQEFDIEMEQLMAEIENNQ